MQLRVCVSIMLLTHKKPLLSPFFTSYITITFMHHDIKWWIKHMGPYTNCSMPQSWNALRAHLTCQFTWFFSCFDGCTRFRNINSNFSNTFVMVFYFYFLIYKFNKTKSFNKNCHLKTQTWIVGLFFFISTNIRYLEAIAKGVDTMLNKLITAR